MKNNSYLQIPLFSVLSLGAILTTIGVGGQGKEDVALLAFILLWSFSGLAATVCTIILKKPKPPGKLVRSGICLLG